MDVSELSLRLWVSQISPFTYNPQKQLTWNIHEAQKR